MKMIAFFAYLSPNNAMLVLEKKWYITFIQRKNMRKEVLKG